MPGRPWTPADISDLVEMVWDKTIDREIAAELGRTTLAVKATRIRLRKAGRRGMRKKHGRVVNVELRERVLAEIRVEPCQLRLAGRLGITEGSVHNLIRRMVRDGLLRAIPTGKNRHRYVPTDLDDNESYDWRPGPGKRGAA